jgi:hypothetical protein
MNTTFVTTFALAAALLATACGKAEAPATPVASLNTPTATSPASPPSPPATQAPEIALPPLPANITSAPELPASAAPTAKDTPANNPKGELTASEEDKSMPKALGANNHSSTALDDKASQK